MALSQFDLSELLDALRCGGDVDLIRSSVEMVLQALIDAEATEMIGAGRHERTPGRTNQRNGSRAKLLSMKAGDVELAIPKLRHGSFFPSILDRVGAENAIALLWGGGRRDACRSRGLFDAWLGGADGRDRLRPVVGREASIDDSQCSCSLRVFRRRCGIR